MHTYISLLHFHVISVSVMTLIETGKISMISATCLTGMGKPLASLNIVFIG